MSHNVSWVNKLISISFPSFQTTQSNRAAAASFRPHRKCRWLLSSASWCRSQSLLALKTSQRRRLSCRSSEELAISKQLSRITHRKSLLSGLVLMSATTLWRSTTKSATDCTWKTLSIILSTWETSGTLTKQFPIWPGRRRRWPSTWPTNRR